MKHKLKKPPTPQNKQFLEKAKKATEIQKTLGELVAPVIKQWRIDNPDLVAKYSTRTEIVCRPRGQEGFTEVYPKIVERMFFKKNEGKTQIDILKDVRPLFPKLVIHPGVWQHDIPKWAFDKIDTFIACSMYPVDIRKCKTLSQIKKKLDAAIQAKAALRTFKTAVAISRDAIVIGDESYLIEARKVGDYKYRSIRVKTNDGKRSWIRVDALINLLEKEV